MWGLQKPLLWQRSAAWLLLKTGRVLIWAELQLVPCPFLFPSLMGSKREEADVGVLTQEESRPQRVAGVLGFIPKGLSGRGDWQVAPLLTQFNLLSLLFSRTSFSLKPQRKTKLSPNLKGSSQGNKMRVLGKHNSSPTTPSFLGRSRAT